jgi:hypothetical protein
MVGDLYGDETGGAEPDALRGGQPRFTKYDAAGRLHPGSSTRARSSSGRRVALERGNHAKALRLRAVFPAGRWRARIGPGTIGRRGQRAASTGSRGDVAAPPQTVTRARPPSQRFSGSTLRLEERLYSDDWGLDATTTDLR